MESDVSYEFKNLIELIELTEKYKNRRKRPRSSIEQRIAYNEDIECLVDCLGPLKKLNDLIGMDTLKKNIIDQVLFFAQGLNTNEMMHTCLTGPPGVGKTTVGKILGELYSRMGFLKEGHFKVVSRVDFVAGYLGQTALKTQKILKSSLGGVLFIDEAYSLGTSDDSFSKEAIDTINKFLSENTSNFIMIIAGYKDELDKYFFSLNAGLRRRFPWVYNIEKYNNKNLKDIFIHQVTSNDWYLDPSVLEGNELDTFFDNSVFDNNGGDTLILFDKAKICHSRRVFGKHKKLKRRLTLEDLENAMHLLREYKREKDIKPPPFGMYC
jgi:replication-associated recombination protein RarA